MRTVPHIWSARIDPVPLSARDCRQAVTELLQQADADDLIADAALLVSELVANVVLHARTSGEVFMSVCDGALLVEVADASPVTPAPQSVPFHSSTGRGLALVAAIASAWGATPVAGCGKVMWFELGGPPRPAPPAGQDDAASGRAVQLLGAPAALGMATIEHGTSLRREMDPVALSAGGGLHGDVDRYVDRYVDFGTLGPDFDAAVTAGLSTVDVTMTVAENSASVALGHLALVEEGDRLAREGATLAAPADPEVARCRRWMLTEVSRQLRGAGALAWEPLGEPIDQRSTR